MFLKKINSVCIGDAVTSTGRTGNTIIYIARWRF